jgi:signal transduction histidine kinase
MDRDLSDDVHKYAQLVGAAINFETSSPGFDPARLPSSKEFRGPFRLIRGEDVFFEGRGRFPAGEAGWLFYSLPLPEGYILEVALNQGQHHQALTQYLSTTWISLLLSLLLAFGLAAILWRYLLRPVQTLQTATQSLARERFPKPLPVAGTDEMARLTQSFNQMVERIRAALERERSFTRYASHELRTPLSALKANISAARLGLMSQEEVLQVAERNLNRMERTLDGLLGLARGPGEATSVAFPDFLQELVESFPHSDQARLRVCGQIGLWVAPRESLEGAVRNLVENALRYTEGPVELIFDHNHIAIRDYGSGVPKEALKRLGEPFFRLHPQLEGTGLGLTYTRQVAEAIGGRLELRSHSQGGLEATLVLVGGTHA